MMLRVIRSAAPTLVLAASLAILACGIEEDLDPPRGGECSPIDEDAKDHDLLAEIEAMGLCASTAIDLGDEYLVESDIAVPKERLRDKQRSLTNLVDIENVEQITVRVDAALPNAWRTATQGATAAWNKATVTAVHFQLTNAAVANINVVDDGGALPDDNGVADALPPSNKLPGNRIRINTTFNYLSADEKLHILAHELSHTIGFQHTGTMDGVWIPGTPTTDAASVMNVGITSTVALSAGDVDAVRILYPYRVNSLTAQLTGCVLGAPAYTLSWGPPEGGVIDWQLQRLSGSNYVDHYQGLNEGIPFSGSSNVLYTFRVRANTILGATAWKVRSFQAPDCGGPPEAL